MQHPIGSCVSKHGDTMTVHLDDGKFPLAKPEPATIILDSSAGCFMWSMRLPLSSARELAADLIAAADRAEGIKPADVLISADEKQALLEVAA